MSKRVAFSQIVFFLISLVLMPIFTETQSPPPAPQPIPGMGNNRTPQPELDEGLQANVAETLNGFAGGFMKHNSNQNNAIHYSLRSPQMTIGFGTSQLYFSILPTALEGGKLGILSGEEPFQGDRTPPAYVSVTFPGSNAVVPKAEAPTNTYYNCYYGADPAHWTVHNRYYTRLLYQDLYENIDLLYEVRENQLKYEFWVHPGGKLEDIQLCWEGAAAVTLDATELVITIDTPQGPFTIQDTQPICYQSAQRKRPIEGSYKLLDTTTYGFAVPTYDPQRLLIIDPFLQYSTFLGGSASETGYAIALDATGNVWLTGQTGDGTTDFPATADAINTTHNGPSFTSDVFVAMLSKTGQNLLYATFLGGSGYESGYAFAFDAMGNAWITGYTESTDFPATSDALNNTNNGGQDVFAVKLSNSGQTLLYSTYLGGLLIDRGQAIAVDANGIVWITGDTQDSAKNFPATTNALNITNNGGQDVFLACLSSDGRNLLYSTFLGGLGSDCAYDLAFDANDDVWITGSAYDAATDFPTTADALNTSHNQQNDVFLARISNDGQSLLYSTFLGGAESEYGYSLALDASGTVWVAGHTWDHTTTDFPTTTDALNTSHNGMIDVFLARISDDGQTLLYSTFLGGTGEDYFEAFAIDAAGALWLTGYTESTDIPTTADAINATYCGGTYDAFVMRLSTTGQALLYSTYIGGSGTDRGFAFAPTATGAVWLTGDTQDDTTDFPTTADAINTTHNQGYDVFVSLISLSPPSAPQDLSATVSSNQSVLLVWNAPLLQGDAPITSYRVYRSTTSGSYGAPLAETTQTFFFDSMATGGQIYHYVVTALNIGGEGALSNETTIFLPLAITAPSPPESLSATPGESAIVLSWSAPSDGGSPITIYRVYRGTISGMYALIGVTASTTFNDTTVLLGITYYYVVTAANAIGNSDFSSEVSATPFGTSDPILTVPNPAQNLLATAGEHFVELSWAGPNNTGGTPITGYRVYRRTASGEYGLLTITTNTAFNDTAVTGGVTYYYVVTALNSVGESSFSSEASATPSGSSQILAAPTSPQDLSATVGGLFVFLSWIAPASDGGAEITYYRVYRGTKQGEYLLLAVVMQPQYNDTAVQADTPYYYLVTAVNAIGESGFSTEVSATPSAKVSTPSTAEKSLESEDSSAPSFLLILLFFSMVVLIGRKRNH
ncbi:MAG: fibronectin type III domain-containing protein [Candidatus Thorarchaeota archaeon]